MVADPVSVVSAVAQALERLGVRHLVGGSLASSVYGTPRATQDADIVADLAPDQVPSLVAALSNQFYADAEMIGEAVRRRASFNLLYLPTMFKIDVFVMREDAWWREEMARGRAERVGEGIDAYTLRFASPEDMILQKLVWFKMGGGISDRQWSDVLGILRVQRATLDREYLERWSAHLGVEDLLLRATSEAA